MKNYEKILELLEQRYGWYSTNSLTSTGKRLVKDTLNANQLIEDSIKFEEIRKEKKETKKEIIVFIVISTLIAIGGIQVLKWIIYLGCQLFLLMFKFAAYVIG